MTSPIPGLERNPVIEVYKRDVDLTLIRENLRLTPDQRLRKLTAAVELIEELRRGLDQRRQDGRVE